MAGSSDCIASNDPLCRKAKVLHPCPNDQSRQESLPVLTQDWARGKFARTPHFLSYSASVREYPTLSPAV